MRRDPIHVAVPHRQTGAPPSVLDLVARRDQDLPAPLIERSHDPLELGGCSAPEGAVAELGKGSLTQIGARAGRSEEHTSELQSLLRISYAVFCLTKTTSHTSTHYRLRHKP